MSDVCGDNRFEIIEAYKKKLIEDTNIESRLDEMAVIDNILLRFWQMGWLPDFQDSNVGDTISRRAAIDALKNWYDGMIISSFRGVEKVIKALPSAQPESNWIPVSDRMPKDGENCLVSVRYSNDFLVDRGTYSTDLFKVDEEHFFGKRGESGWYHLSSEYGYCKILNVIAWMPEPRPYKEIKDEGFN